MSIDNCPHYINHLVRTKKSLLNKQLSRFLETPLKLNSRKNYTVKDPNIKRTFSKG